MYLNSRVLISQLHIDEPSIHKKTHYDNRGNIIYQMDYDANINGNNMWCISDIVSYDCFGRIKARYKNFFEYALDNDSLPSDSLHVFSRHKYDILDRPTGIKWLDQTQQTYQYSLGVDAFNIKRLISSFTDEKNRVSLQFITPQGWTTTSIGPDGSTTTFEYDALGQLLQSTDPDGIPTVYHYDGLGRTIERNHPDAGTTLWIYDHAGNLTSMATQNQINKGEITAFEYEYNRLKSVHHSHDSIWDTYYEYDNAGRISKRTDMTGFETLEYDELGNISASNKTISIPIEDQAYHFRTQFSYDVLGRISTITYPDSEMVVYQYNHSNLNSIISTDNNQNTADTLLQIDYDAYGSPIKHITSNGYQTDYSYSPTRRWLERARTYKGNIDLLDFHYGHDAVGNIFHIEQWAEKHRCFGGPTIQYFFYDSQNRLTRANMDSEWFGGYRSYDVSYSPSGLIGIKSCPDMLWNYWYGYNYDVNTNQIVNHQIRSIYDMEFDETTFFKWDANGQLTDVIRPCSGDHRHHWWNESGQMVAFVDNEHCGYYGYNAEGERTYKLTGESLLDQHNAGEQNFQMYFNNAVLYVNPYMVVTPKGYTKHYYNGSQRIAARIGILDDLPDDIIDTSAVALERISNARAYMENTLNISEPQTMDTASVFADIDGGIYPELQWQCIDDDYQTLHVTAHCDSNILYPILTKDSSHLDRRISGIYFYHSDHLGSATWITDGQGLPVQFMHYMPYGELWYDQQASAYDERYKFTGKERDRESGYDFFGARYYSSAVLSWLSVDPWSDKYPHISPYAYCAWNPMNYVDPDGRDVYQYDNETGDFKLYQKTEDNFDQIGKFTYNRKSGEYLPKLGRDGNIKTYSDHLGNSNQIAKGILKDGLNLRDNGGVFMLGEKTKLTQNDIYNFALILDEVVGKEISGFIYTSPFDAQSQYVQMEPYKKNTYNMSKNRLRDYSPNTVIQHFHTHGQAPNIMEAITPSPRYDIPAKNKMLERYPTSQFYILHNYGAPIKY